jgi:4-hydroxybenzoyl-CoA thioesterase
MRAQTSRRRIKIEFGHCDPAHIAYYPNLVAWVDQATHQFFEAIGFAVRDLQADRRLQVPVVGLNVEFLSPATWGEEIEIDSQVNISTLTAESVGVERAQRKRFPIQQA